MQALQHGVVPACPAGAVAALREARIEAQGGNSHPAGMPELDDTVGLIHGDGDLRQPRRPDHLACPLGDGLCPAPGPLTCGLAPTLRMGKAQRGVKGQHDWPLLTVRLRLEASGSR